MHCINILFKQYTHETNSIHIGDCLSFNRMWRYVESSNIGNLNILDIYRKLSFVHCKLYIKNALRGVFLHFVADGIPYVS